MRFELGSDFDIVDFVEGGEYVFVCIVICFCGWRRSIVVKCLFSDFECS